MTAIRSYRHLEVWQRAMDFAVRCYGITRSFPPDERFDLTRQIRRAAVSVPSNIAEGFNRRARQAYINHLTIALGSHGELDTQLELAGRIGYVDQAASLELRKDIETVGRLLSGLVRSL